MAKIEQGTLHNYKNGEVVIDQFLNADNEVIRTAINDNDDQVKSHKSASVLDHPDGSVTNVKLADSSVTTTKIVDGAVTTSKIASGALDGRYYTETEIDQKLSQLVIGQIPGGVIQRDNIANGAISTAKLADGAVTAAKVSTEIATTEYVNAYSALWWGGFNVT